MVNQPKWTPGPWTLNLHHTKILAGRVYGFIHAGAAVPIAAVVLGVEGVSEAEGRANAHLLGAALDLYAGSDQDRIDLEALHRELTGSALAVIDTILVSIDRRLARARGED